MSEWALKWGLWMMVGGAALVGGAVVAAGLWLWRLIGGGH